MSRKTNRKIRRAVKRSERRMSLRDLDNLSNRLRRREWVRTYVSDSRNDRS